MENLNEILKQHAAWTYDSSVGQCANLRDANLSDANLRGADLRGANLRDANLSDANLRGADLRDANLRDANLSDANLRDANLRGADLSDANLRYANLRDADLRDANLRGANLRDADLRDADLRDADLRGADLPSFQIPQEGDLVVWKAVSGGIAKLLIPAEAKRTASLVGRKCRTEYAKVLEILDESVNPKLTGKGWYNKTFIYSIGETVHPDSYDDDPRIECTHGIHFFLTKEEAQNWS